MSSERTALLRQRSQVTFENEDPTSLHAQFCMLTGTPPSNLRPGTKAPVTSPKSLYGRASKAKKSTTATYYFTATLSNSMLLAQVVLGAAVTALGASESSHILITVFGAMNTIIAGLVAYLKSRGQPMRARMFADDLERVVDEIENSEIMWLGITKDVNGYDDIDTIDTVTVRSEVARLTRLYERALRNNSLNNPDMYMSGAPGEGGAASPLKHRTPQPQQTVPVSLPQTTPTLPSAPISTVLDPDESPASAPPKPPPPPPLRMPSNPAMTAPSLTGPPATQEPPISSEPPPIAPDAATSSATTSQQTSTPSTVTKNDSKQLDTPVENPQPEDNKPPASSSDPPVQSDSPSGSQSKKPEQNGMPLGSK